MTFCSHCGFANEIDAHYCGGCGKSLHEKRVSQATQSKSTENKVALETTNPLTTDQLSELEKINQRRRETLGIAGSRKTLHQDDLDKLFGEEKK